MLQLIHWLLFSFNDKSFAHMAAVFKFESIMNFVPMVEKKTHSNVIGGGGVKLLVIDLF